MLPGSVVVQICHASKLASLGRLTSRNSCNLWGVLAHITGESLPEIDGALQTCRTECELFEHCFLLLLLLSSSSHLSSKNSSFTTGLASLSSLSTPSTTCCYFLFYFNKFPLPLQLHCTAN
ncbi:hypothetical protein T05_5006 [Trichinella murrelli]|uniref:Uncharacterized protein n=1 Tax=Trichinella murrelli TaxID=144512 RepID=A0A0V0U1W0_9BILA|nr:hypothetical protein T05_5006 [Trichinella murrelli]